mgnify:CR=1 FL=1
MLLAANLVASVDYQYSDSVEAGNVIKYSPSGSVAEGSTVTIHVSRGKKVTNVSVPNVLGMSESLASQTLDSANLKVTVKYETSSKAVREREKDRVCMDYKYYHHQK